MISTRLFCWPFSVEPLSLASRLPEYAGMTVSYGYRYHVEQSLELTRSCFSPRNLHPLCAMTCALAPRKDVEAITYHQLHYQCSSRREIDRHTDTLVSSSLPKKERVPISPPASAVANASSHDLTSTGLPHVAIFSHSSFLFLPPKGR